MVKEEIEKIIKEATGESVLEFSVETSDNLVHGDYSTNVALILAKKLKKNPKEVAENLITEIRKSLIRANNGREKGMFEKIEVAGCGFINFFLSKEYLQEQLQRVLREKEKFGNLNIGKKQRVNVEFISANPTGPLTLGNGRGGFCGDVLANVLKKAGYEVVREYYINDRGEQIIKLGHSVLGDKQAVYKGDYIDELRKKVWGNNVEKTGKMAAEIILEKMIKPTIKRMGIHFDVWFSESTLYESGLIDRVIEELTKRGWTYKSEGATWFKCKELEDDKDRVLIRKDGIRTYFASDIAYLKNKIDRGFKKIILFVGADHYGYVPRLKAAAYVLGFNKKNIEAIVLQMVRLFKDGKEVKMSKRGGVYVTLDELLDEIGIAAARFFFLTRSANTHLNFDLNLAKEQSEKNPVYYIQYAYARICSILRKARNFKFLIFSFPSKPNFQLLKEESELNLIKQIVRLPEVVNEIASDYQVQRLPQYAIELADVFHHFYETCRVMSEDKKLVLARLGLVKAAKIVLKNVLDLMGISAPEKM